MDFANRFCRNNNGDQWCGKPQLLGPGERYHEPLRRVFNKVRNDHPQMDRNLVLRLVLKACNDTLGSEEIVLSLLIFGCIPIFTTVNCSIPSQTKRMRAMQKAKKEMATIIAKLKI